MLLRNNQIISESKNRKGTNKKGIFSCSRESKKFEAKFSKAVTTDRRNGSRQIAMDCYDELVKRWGGSPASEPLSCGSSTTCVDDNINADNFSDDLSSSSSNSL